jgi:hypothetical protein
MRPPSRLWVASLHDRSEGGKVLGSGVVIDESRVLTCAHVVLDSETGASRGQVWVALPFAGDLMDGHVLDRSATGPGNHPEAGERVRVEQIGGHTTRQEKQDAAVLVLSRRLPSAVPARLRCPPGTALVDEQWWSFGFGRGDPFGGSAHGYVSEAVGYGWVELECDSGTLVERGFSGAPVWSPVYNAVIGIMGHGAQNGAGGRGRCLTLLAIDRALKEERLSVLCEWSAEAAGEDALAAWGWQLADDPEAERHWLPRARGVSSNAEPGFRFRGRTAALTTIVEWMGRPVGANRQVLVVTGSPGVGKSAVLGRVVTTADASIASALPASDRAVRAPLGSIACAVHAKSRTALEVARMIAIAASAPIPEHAYDLAAGLRTALTDSPRHGFAVVIDAVDEAATPDHARAIILEVAVPMAQYCSDLGVRVVVGSRRRDDAGDLLANFGLAAQPLDLDDPQFFEPEDLAEYTLATLQLLGHERHGNPYAQEAIARPVANRIAELADQNFLIAGLVARQYGMNHDQPVPVDQIKFSPTVDAVLRQYLAGLRSIDGIPAVDALAALAFSQVPGLGLELWQAALTALTGRVPTLRGLRSFAQSSAANFLIETSSTQGPDHRSVRSYRLFHQALNDALLAGRDVEADEHAITEAFIGVGRVTGWDRAPAYLLRSLPHHATRGGVIDDVLGDDHYPLYADLRQLIPAAAGARSPDARGRARLLRKTPRAIDVSPAERAALFSVTEAQEHLGTTYRDLDTEHIDATAT